MRRVMSRVPEVTIYFWIAKVLTTGMGETTSDFLVHRISPLVAVAFGALGLAVALALQLALRRYVAWAYCFAVVMVSVFGTMAADAVHIGLGIPYLVSTLFFVVALAVIFALWYASERTLSIHSIRTRRRELFYWATVLATFALGTAVGDMTAVTLHLGYLASGILFAVLIATPAVAHWHLGSRPRPRVLARLRRHPTARRLLCRLGRRVTCPWWSRPGHRDGQPRVDGADRRIRRLPRRDPQGRQRHRDRHGVRRHVHHRLSPAPVRPSGGRPPSVRMTACGPPMPSHWLLHNDSWQTPPPSCGVRRAAARWSGPAGSASPAA